MANALPHRETLALVAKGLGEDARLLGVQALSGATMAAATKLVGSVLANSGAGPVGEAAGDVRTLRMDPAFNMSMMRDLTKSQQKMTEKMLLALEAGYSDEMAFQITQIAGLSFTVTDADRRDMRDYPIQGHTCAEISQYMHNSIRYEVTGLLSSPLTGDSEVSTLNDLLAVAANRFGDRCSTAVQEAYYAGTQMALRGVATALGAT